MQVDHYDALIIGSGQAGKPLALDLAKAGWKTALIERDQVGGTCINVGCTPTKTLVASARVAYLARRAGDYGITAGPIGVNFAAVRQRKQAIVESFRNGSQRRLEEAANLDLLFGEARFLSSDSIVVTQHDGTTRTLSAPKIFLNTGGRPSNPQLAGADTVSLLDSSSIMELDATPEHLLVLGGGYIGLEFGQMFRRFGSRVTIVQRASQLLGREDEDVAAEVLKLMQEDGVEVLLNTTAVRVAQLPNRQLELTVKTPDGERVLTGSHVLAAAGRTPNTETLNLAAAGVATDRHGFIVANERLETNIPGIYALGDVKGGPQFTHISYDDYRIIRTNLLEGGDATIRERQVPYTVFIDPQLGRVGLTETEARAQGRNIRVFKMPMEYVARALEMDESRGLMKAVVDAESQQILGCAILGIEGGELMSMLQIAMLGKVPYTVLKDTVFAHPTLAEAFNNLFQ